MSLDLEHLSVVCHLFKSDLKPLGVMLGVALDVFLQVGDRHVLPRGDFFSVDARNVVALANPHMVKLMLGEALSDGRLIYKGVDFVHRTTHAHLFPKAA